MARVLIAEDDDLVAEILSNALMDAGHAAGVIADGTQALRTILAQKPDIVLLDCDLPGTHGVSILKQIRLDPNLWRIPVLMLTGCRSRSDEEIALYAGANGYLRKPFDPDYVVYRLEEALASRQQSLSPNTGRPAC